MGRVPNATTSHSQHTASQLINKSNPQVSNKTDIWETVPIDEGVLVNSSVPHTQRLYLLYLSLTFSAFYITPSITYTITKAYFSSHLDPIITEESLEQGKRKPNANKQKNRRKLW